MKNKFFLKWKQGLLMLLLLCAGSFAYGQNITVQGQVSDQDGPLAGASITVKGTSTGVIADGEGRYSISAKSDAVLVVSYLGYETQEAVVAGQKEVNVTLTSNANELEDIVVIGYGTVRKGDITGAVSSIKTEDLSFPTSNLAEMMRGKATGVKVSITSGRPGADVNIEIRGKRSLSGGNDPLYIVDGAPMESISEINPNDIKSIEVLKDAASQAIYGARAANGVVLITTMRGTETGKIDVTYSGYFGVQSLHRNFDFYSGDEFITLRREAMRTDNGGAYPTYAETFGGDQIMEEVYASKQYVDWEDLMLKKATQQSHDVSIRGGTNKSKFSLAIGYYDQNGMIANTGYQRGNARFNWDYKLRKNVSVGINTSYSLSQRKDEGSGTIVSYITTPPLAKPYDAEGNVNYLISNSQEYINPLWQQREEYGQTTKDIFNLGGFATWEIIEGLSYRFNGNLSRRIAEEGKFQSKKYKDEQGNGVNTASLNADNNFVGDRFEWLIENQLNYKKEFLDIHNLDIMVAQSANRITSKTTGYSGSNMPTDFFAWDGLPDAEVGINLKRTNTQRSLVSILGRVQYSLMNRYLLTLSVRRDGSSVFGESNKWANFPSVSAAWKMQEEEFMKSLTWINQLKLRGSYGSVGNEAIPMYRTLGLASPSKFAFGDGNIVTGYLPGGTSSSSDIQLVNPNLKWETTTSWNIGLDYGFIDHRLTGSIEYYQTQTKDLLVKKSILQLLGYSYMWDNLGKTESKGFEFSLSADIIRSQKANGFKWTADLNYSAMRNKILEINGEVDAKGNPINDIDNKWFIGQPINVAYNYAFDGIWQLDDDIANSHMPLAKPGDIKLKDLSGPDGAPDGKITVDDRHVINLDPKWIGSLTNSFYFMGFDLSAELYTVQGVTKTNPYLTDANNGGSLQGKRNGVKVNYWTPENPSNEFPRPHYNSSPTNMGVMTYQDASYWRLRTVTFGYTFPKPLLAKVKMTKARAYVTATNLFTQTDYLSYSPEATPGAYPEPRSVVFGLTLSF